MSTSIIYHSPEFLRNASALYRFSGCCISWPLSFSIAVFRCGYASLSISFIRCLEILFSGRLWSSKGFPKGMLFTPPFRLDLFNPIKKLFTGKGFSMFHSLFKFLLTHRERRRDAFLVGVRHAENITTTSNKYVNKKSQLHQNLLISVVVALLAWRDTIRSSNSKIYKMGMTAWQKPTLKKTGYKSSGCVISNTCAWVSSMASSNQLVDLMPERCNSDIERNEWSNLMSMDYLLVNPEENQFLRKNPKWCDFERIALLLHDIISILRRVLFQFSSDFPKSLISQKYKILFTITLYLDNEDLHKHK